MTDHPKGLTELLSQSLDFFVRHFSSLLGLSLIVFLPAMVIYVFIFTGLDLSSAAGQRSFSEALNIYTRLGSYFLVITLTGLVYQISLVRSIQRFEIGQDFVDGRYLLEEVRRTWWPFLGVVMLAFLKVIGWSILFLVPGIIFGLLYSFATLAFLVDGHMGRMALVYSKSIIRPQILRFVGYLFTVGALTTIVSAILSVLVSAVFGVRTETNTGLVPTIGEAIGNLGGVVVGNFALIFYYLFYKELKRKAASNVP